MNPLQDECIVPSLVEIGLVVLEKKTFLISSVYFRYFLIISPWKRTWSFIWTNLNLFQLKMHCAKFGWNRLSGSGKEDFLISSVYFRYFLIISPWKRAWPIIWTKLNPLHTRMFCASLVEIRSVVLEKKIFLNLSMYFRYFVIISLWKRARLFIWTQLNPLYPRMPCAKFGWILLSG